MRHLLNISQWIWTPPKSSLSKKKMVNQTGLPFHWGKTVEATKWEKDNNLYYKGAHELEIHWYQKNFLSTLHWQVDS
jgi:hypothetical protein